MGEERDAGGRRIVVRNGEGCRVGRRHRGSTAWDATGTRARRDAEARRRREHVVGARTSEPPRRGHRVPSHRGRRCAGPRPLRETSFARNLETSSRRRRWVRRALRHARVRGIALALGLASTGRLASPGVLDAPPVHRVLRSTVGASSSAPRAPRRPLIRRRRRRWCRGASALPRLPRLRLEIQRAVEGGRVRRGRRLRRR